MTNRERADAFLGPARSARSGHDVNLCERLLDEAEIRGAEKALRAAAEVADEADRQAEQPHMVAQGYRPLGVGGDIRALSAADIVRGTPEKHPMDGWRQDASIRGDDPRGYPQIGTEPEQARDSRTEETP